MNALRDRQSQDVPLSQGQVVSRLDVVGKEALSAEHFKHLDDVYNEFCEMEEKGTPVDPDTFCARYPSVQSSLARLLRAHLFLAEHSEYLAEEDEPAWPKIGQEVAGFKLIHELGQGAFSRVFQATETALGDRLVAIKVSTIGNAEAKTLGRLDHQGVVGAHSVSMDPASGLWVVCMPYRGSATLHNVLDRLSLLRAGGESLQGRHLLDACHDPFAPENEGGLPLPKGRDASFSDTLRRLAIQLAEALVFIHGKGIHHRDLKPSNVLLRSDGAPLLIDFNLSADTSRPSSRVGGTPLYMASEQLEALARRGAPGIALDHRTDLFSLGVILYELATGKHPFGPIPFMIASKDLRTLLLERHQQGFEPLRKACPELDADLASVIDRCLAQEPKLRPASAQEVLDRLNRPLPWPQRAFRVAMRRPRAVFAGLFALVALGLLFAVQLKGASTRDLMLAGQTAFQNGNFEQAKLNFNQVLHRNPEHVDALLLRGRTYVRMNDLHSANADFHEADRLKPDGVAKAWRGYCFQRLREPRGALPAYEGARAMGIRSVAVYNNLGMVHFAQGEELDRAHEALLQALKLDPKCQAVHHNLALLAIKKGLAEGPTKRLQAHTHFQEGIKHAHNALAFGPQSTELLFDCASLHALSARVDPAEGKDAVDFLTKALRQGQDQAALRSSSLLSAITAEVETLLDAAPPVEALASKAERLLEPTTP